MTVLPGAPSKKLAVLGAGNMAMAIVSGLVRVGWSASEMVLTTRNPQHAQERAEKVGARTAPDNRSAAEGADIVLVAVKPVGVPAVLREISSVLKDGALVVSVAVGVTTQVLEANLPQSAGVVRVLPNTPAGLGLAMTVLCPGKSASQTQVDTAVNMFAAVGKTLVLDEKDLNVAGALSGSGTGYLFYVAEAMVEAGVTLGLARADAQRLTSQALYGAAALLVANGNPGALREEVTSPGGTTAAAFRKFEEHAVRAAFLDGIEACANRSAELSRLAAGNGNT